MRKQRVSFRTWVMKLDGIEPPQLPDIPTYPQPTEKYEHWTDLLEHYSVTGLINRGYLRNGFYWRSTAIDSKCWVRLYEGEEDALALECLNSWVEQEGLPVPNYTSCTTSEPW